MRSLGASFKDTALALAEAASGPASAERDLHGAGTGGDVSGPLSPSLGARLEFSLCGRGGCCAAPESDFLPWW